VKLAATFQRKIDRRTAAITSTVTTSKSGVSSIVLSWPKRRAAAPTNAKASVAANCQSGLKLRLRRRLSRPLRLSFSRHLAQQAPGYPNPVGFFERSPLFAERRSYPNAPIFNRPRPADRSTFKRCRNLFPDNRLRQRVPGSRSPAILAVGKPIRDLHHMLASPAVVCLARKCGAGQRRDQAPQS